MCALLVLADCRSGLFTPDEAFEYIVQMQIAKFEDPIMKCVDMVSSELTTIIHEATNKVSRATSGAKLASHSVVVDEPVPAATTSN